jgi:hypothetical protein
MRIYDEQCWIFSKVIKLAFQGLGKAKTMYNREMVKEKEIDTKATQETRHS